METNKLIPSNANLDMKRYFLPEEIIAEILPRLPVESVLKCRRVCKTWRTLTYHPSFAHLQLLHSLQLDNDDDDDDEKYYAAVRSKEGLLYSFSGNDEKTGLHYLEYDRQDGSYKKITKINYPLFESYCTIVGSCNGLICFSKYHNDMEDSVYICNPITREHIELPKFTKPDDDGLCTYGFGYNRKANEYKVVGMYYPGFDTTGQVHVYTLGSGCGWRNKGEITYRCESECYVANGALHWHAVYGHIVSFNLADENFCLLPSSPLTRINDSYEYNVLGGLLSAIHYVADGSVNIWSFNSSMKENKYQSGSWNLVFNIKLEGNNITNITRRNEQFPLAMSGEVLSCYLKRLENPLRWPISETIPHMNSFTSLKSLGEDAKIIKSAEELVESESK